MHHPNPINATNRLVEQNYQPDQDADGFLAKVTRMVNALTEGPLPTAALAGLDQFHARGLPATRELAELAGIRPGNRVLDAGSGLGGPARFLAETFGCEVVGVDLTPGFVAVSELLTRRTGLEGRVRFRVGDLTALAFPDDSFDVVWTQHVVMNIPARDELYREVRRVLRTGGKFAFYDVIAADEKPAPVFPVPWARTPETSFLLNQAETLAALGGAGLTTTVWKDVTEEGLASFGSGQPAPTAAPALSLVGLYGPATAEWIGNFARNLRERRIHLVMGVAEPAGARVQAARDAQ